MAIEEVIVTASKMYGISTSKSRKLIEALLQSNQNINEAEILKQIGQQSIFYLAEA